MTGHPHAEVRTGSTVEHVAPARGGGFEVAGDREERRHDAVVLALDAIGLRSLVARSERLGDSAWRERVARLRNAPPFLVTRLWLDRPVAPDRPGFLGTSGFGGLDDISVLDRWEDEAAIWAARTGGSVVELHAYAVDPRAQRTAEERQLEEQLHRVYPETRAATVVDVRHEWREDCPLFPVGDYADRPTIRTSDPCLVVAGDAVRTDLPVALMERAATTGFQPRTLCSNAGVCVGRPCGRCRTGAVPPYCARRPPGPVAEARPGGGTGGHGGAGHRAAAPGTSGRAPPPKLPGRSRSRRGPPERRSAATAWLPDVLPRSAAGDACRLCRLVFLLAAAADPFPERWVHLAGPDRLIAPSSRAAA